MVYYHNAADVKLGADGAACFPAVVIGYPESMQAGEEDDAIASIAYNDDSTTYEPSMRVGNLTLVANDNVRLQPGVMITKAELEGYVMLCDNYGENWSVKNPVAKTMDGYTTQFLFLEDIAPGYDGAGFIFMRIDVVAE